MQKTANVQNKVRLVREKLLDLGKVGHEDIVFADALHLMADLAKAMRLDLKYQHMLFMIAEKIIDDRYEDPRGDDSGMSEKDMPHRVASQWLTGRNRR
jgi:hypothetical protein